MRMCLSAVPATTPRVLAACLTAANLAVTHAEIISYTGSASAEIKQYKGDTLEATDQQGKTYPEATLPLQVVARLISETEDAGGSAAAQFADPATVSGDNPADFAINLALDSLGPTVSYRGLASASETRTIRYSPNEVGGAAEGQRVELRGRLYLDGALTIIAAAGLNDLTGTFVTLRMTVVKVSGPDASETVFSGSLSITGGTDASVSVTAGGDFPRSRVFDADLAALDPQLGVFRAVVIPQTMLEYEYSATVGETFALRATVEVEAANRPGGVGVAAILGTPVDTLTDILTRTRSAATARTVTDGLLKERAEPSGRPAFEEGAPASTPPLFGLCGLLGLESMVSVLGLAGLIRLEGRHRAAARKCEKVKRC